MSEPTTSRAGCMKQGCFGCLIVIALMAVLAVLLGGAQFLFERGGDQEVRSDFRRELPTVDQFRQLTASGEVGAEDRPLEVDDELPLSFQSVQTFEAMRSSGAASKSVRLEFDLDVGEFEIIPGQPGEGVVVEARYDERAIVVAEEYEDSAAGGQMKITAKPKGGKVGILFRGAGAGPKNFVTIKLPPDVILDLRGTIGLGETTVELGGLLIRSLDLKLGTGDHQVKFSEPSPIPMTSFEVTKSVGVLRVGDLGNASPSTVSMNQRIGDLWVDLGGGWRNDSEISLSNQVGKLDVEPAQGARMLEVGSSAMIGEKNLRGLESKAIRAPTEPGKELPTLRLRLEGRIGEMSVHDH